MTSEQTSVGRTAFILTSVIFYIARSEKKAKELTRKTGKTTQDSALSGESGGEKF